MASLKKMIFGEKLSSKSYVGSGPDDRTFYSKIKAFAYRNYILLIIAGFLLGRAAILSKMYPFGLAFYAVILLTFKNKKWHVMISLLLGALTVGWVNAATLMIGIVVYHGLNKLLDDSFEANKVMYGVNVFIAQSAAGLVMGFIDPGPFTTVSVIDIVMEACIAGVLFYVFLQCVHVFTIKKKVTNLKTEEIVSITIIVASALTGTINWEILGLSFGSVVTQYVVLIAAFSCGPTIGTTVGVVTGLVYCISDLNSLYQMTFLAFAGLLAGLLKGGRKIGVAFGLILASIFIDLYAGGRDNIPIHMAESVVAIFVFMLTPKSFTTRIAQLVPGTQENQQENLQYVKRVREVTATRVKQFSEVFEALSKSFLRTEKLVSDMRNQQDIDMFMSKITDKTCQTCFKKKSCWSRNFDETYELMSDLMVHLENDQSKLPQQTKADWKKFCVKFDRVIEAVSKELAYYKANKILKYKVNESRKLVADQLKGVSKVMGDFAKEIQKERKNHEVQEEQIFDAINRFGVEIDKVEIFCLDEGNIDVEMIIDSSDNVSVAEKIIAPMLSDILDEHISLSSVEPTEKPSNFVFKSGRKFQIETGIANVAKGGGVISGDSCTTIDIGYAKQAIAISDGMGNGARAHAVSTETLELLRKILSTGIEEKVAIKAINAVLSLRTTDEIFSTLDLAMVDLQGGVIKFIKIGSTPSFIKRNTLIKKIEGSNLPIGIIKDFEIDSVVEHVHIGDLLIMMSDGIYEAPKNGYSPEKWIAKKIGELKTDNPQHVADLILEDIIRMNDGVINDDMTVVVAKIKENMPRWSNIKVGEPITSNESEFAEMA